MTAVRLLRILTELKSHSLERFFYISLEQSMSASLSTGIISACILFRFVFVYGMPSLINPYMKIVPLLLG